LPEHFEGLAQTQDFRQGLPLCMRSLILRASIVLVVFGSALAFAWIKLTPQTPLPVYNPSDVNGELVAPELQSTGRNHRIGTYSLSDQNGNPFTPETLGARISVVDFFFATCPSICVDMAREMRRLQEHFADNPSIALLSHTVMPEADSTSVLRAYADKQNAKDGKWYFLRASREEIYRLARSSYLVAREPVLGAEDHGLIHTESFVLVDPDKRIRGYYDGTSAESVDQLIEDIERLLDEYPNLKP